MIHRIVPLDPRIHDRQGFDCGNDALDTHIRRHGRQARDAGFASVFVVEHEDDARTIVACYCLSLCELAIDDLPENARRGLPRHPVPAARLARLAIDRRFQGRGVGTLMLTHALRRCYKASMEVAAFAVVVDAKPEAVSFYEGLGFIRLLDYGLMLFLPMKTAALL